MRSASVSDGCASLQVRSIMKSKLSGGSARVTKNQARAQKNQVKKLFDSVDADNNGSLDSVEVTGLLELLGVSLSADERGELVKQVPSFRLCLHVSNCVVCCVVWKRLC